MTAQQKLRLALLALLIAVCVGACARPDVVRPGRGGSDGSQRVNPPSVSKSVVYVVHPGETLGEIARCAGVSVPELARENGIPDPRLILAGEKLRLPAGHDCKQVSKSTAANDPARAARARSQSLLAKANASLDDADFEQALSYAETCADQLSPYPTDPQAKTLCVRCHVVAGTAATGLDQPDRALTEFRRALALDPKLELPESSTSPRVRELVSQARSQPEP
ncbi:MAG TPA: LysM domain-containing protein [Myxococcota bacterium]|nr:LysM domain-containing protein [Myxococcota bacterium]